MTNLFFKIYSILLPLTLYPILFYFGRKLKLADSQSAILLSFAILYAYIIPWWGISIMKLWSVRGKFTIRWNNGLIFGSFSMLLLSLVLYDVNFLEISTADYFLKGLTSFSVLALWHWLFDAFANQKGFILCYNYEYSQRKSSLEITMAYAPLIFGIQGFVLSCIALNLIHHWQLGHSLSLIKYLSFLAIYLVSPTCIYALSHRLFRNTWGLKSYYQT